MRNISALKDDYLSKHHAGVALYAGLMARILCPSMIEIVTVGAMYHDMGKIGIPDGVLFKPGRLDELEWNFIRQHPVLGAEYIEKANGGMGLNGDLSAVVMAIRHHHERWDGMGYPDGLAGEKIPLAARIITVADTFDAMTTDRPYRKALPREDTLREIVRCAGTQFDPAIVEAFVKVVDLGG
ncbi:MAG: HD-GYP domain-containing protein [Peptococcaceae bacterium]|nr:HD-GYP domain-containing protein [Peptococcaceae bacterium]